MSGAPIATTSGMVPCQSEHRSHASKTIDDLSIVFSLRVLAQVHAAAQSYTRIQIENRSD